MLEGSDDRKRRTCNEFNPKSINRYGFSTPTGSNSTKSPNLSLSREREQKWFEMLRSWDNVMSTE